MCVFLFKSALKLNFLVSPPFPPPAFKATFKRSKISASQIANKQGGYYDMFSTVCFADSFIPNERLRLLVRRCNDETNSKRAIILSWELNQLFYTNETFRPMADGSETRVLNPNLQRTLDISLKLTENTSLFYIQERFSCGNFLASATIAEPCIACSLPNVKSHIPLVGCEVKGEEASARVSEPQLMSITGGAAINLRLLGLSIEDSCVPAISLTGEGFRFYAVYLMRDTFPVLTAISRTFNPVTETLAIASWLLNIVEFAEETFKLISALTEYRVPTPTGNETVLDISSYFFKPIRNIWHKGLQINTQTGPPVSSSSSASDDLPMTKADVNHSLLAACSNVLTHVSRIMCIYQHLAAIPESHKFILFPTGVVTVPAADITENRDFREALVNAVCREHFPDLLSCITHRPLIAFDFLRHEEGWKNDRPDLAFLDSYLDNISKAIDIMNTAGVAHLDLRPNNIMWRPVGSTDTHLVEIRIIDFEDAGLFGSLVPPPFVKHVIKHADYRYPFDELSIDKYPKVSEIHNNFFYFVIKGWLLASLEIEYDFDNFMMVTEVGRRLHQTTMDRLLGSGI